MASIRQRGENSFQVTVSNGYDSKGKKLLKTKTINIDPRLTEKQREKELQKQVVLFEEEVKSGSYYEPTKMTMSEFIELWLDKKKNNIESKTHQGYSGLLKGRVLKVMGDTKIIDLKPLHLINFYENLQELGIREDGREGKLSTNSILHYHRALNAMFGDGVRWGLIKENPCSKVRPPKVVKKEMSCLDEDQIPQLISALCNEPIDISTFITLDLVTGLRRGELCGLQWDNVNLKDNTIVVEQAVSYTPETGTIIKTPKTKSSIRKITIPKTTSDLLSIYRKWWLEQKIKVGDQWQKSAREEVEKNGQTWEDPEYLFTTWDGYVMHPDTLTKTFKKFIKRNNLPDIRLHDLRHTAATMLIHAGLNIRAVAARMGHENPNVTLAIYSHALLSADKQAADVMGNLIKKKPQNEKVE
ncbi:site-specific integrase [Ruminiclostridium cellulolyticum]|uniref:Integrase family protein n=1 Tax=Ruminiclostridium cellulolyticum (strain ATCC 35319 / DSM 5812 / JCM 6584 / H10) TaxID=394503 RepID=B8I354_RUMCH|nr:site-specific integrase [Ruminiclostridium cellulolyticum]ACL76197.1 integrase family protein [Ruminiclostridium cellulolyticum H10]